MNFKINRCLTKHPEPLVLKVIDDREQSARSSHCPSTFNRSFLSLGLIQVSRTYYLSNSMVLRVNLPLEPDI